MAVKKSSFNIVDLANNYGCFDLQFRKDTRHERTNSPTYYRWKIQFVITTPKENIKVLEKVAKEMDCGSVSVAKEQARFAVQKIDDIVETIVPYFTKHPLIGNKKKDFSVWQKAVIIIWKNKGIYLSKWEKNDLIHLMEIHKIMAKNKNSTKKSKWIEMAQVLTKKS